MLCSAVITFDGKWSKGPGEGNETPVSVYVLMVTLAAGFQAKALSIPVCARLQDGRRGQESGEEERARRDGSGKGDGERGESSDTEKKKQVRSQGGIGTAKAARRKKV